MRGYFLKADCSPEKAWLFMATRGYSFSPRAFYSFFVRGYLVEVSQIPSKIAAWLFVVGARGYF